MTELDLTAAIEAAAKAFHTFVITEGHASEDAPETWDVIDDDGKQVLIEAMGAAIAVAAPHIVKAVREQVAAQFAAWADEIPADERRTGPRATRYRTLMAAARRAGPTMTTEEVAEAIKAGNFAVCHLDEAGRAIARGGDEASRG